MPQIWLTYDELAVLMDCNTSAARAVAAAFPLDRRRSRDGRTRAKLNAALTEVFLDRMSQARIDRDTAGHGTTQHDTGAHDIAVQVGQLRAMHDRMAERSVKALPAPGASRRA